MLWKFHRTNFLITKCSLAPKTKTKFKFWQCYLKAEGCRISKHPGVIPWPNNLRKKLLCELRQCSFNAPKKCTFFSIYQRKTLFYHEKRKAPFQMTYTIGKVWLRQFVCLVLGSQHILILALEFFQRSGHCMVPISCKASYIGKKSQNLNFIMLSNPEQWVWQRRHIRISYTQPMFYTSFKSFYFCMHDSYCKKGFHKTIYLLRK